MVQKTLRAITAKISGLHEAAFWLASFSIFSQILAFLRDRLLAHNFGAGQQLDIYYTAFRIPDFIFVTVGSLVSISVLVPMFSKKATKDSAAMKSYTNSIFTGFSALIVLSCGLAFFLMPYLAKFLFKGFDTDSVLQIVKFSRVLLFSPLLLGLSNFFGAIVQYEKRFLLHSLSPLFYNLGIISGTIFGAANFGVMAVVCGVIFGALMHMFIPAGFLVWGKKLPILTKKINWIEIKETVFISLPRALALSATQIINIVFTVIASFFSAGAIAVFNLGLNLQSVPLSIIGASYSLAAFPTLSEHYAMKNIKECGRHINESLRYIIFWTLPISVLFIILRAHIVRIVLGTGAFDWTDTKLTAAVLSLFAISFVFQSAQLFLTRSHYALGKTKMPLIIGLFGAFVTVILAILFYTGYFSGFVLWLQNYLEVENLPGANIIILPLSFSLGSLFSVFGLWLFLDREAKIEAKNNLLRTFFEVLIAALVLGVTTFYALRLFDDFFTLNSLSGVLGHAVVSGLVGIIVAVMALLLFKNREIKEISKKIFK